MPHFEKHFTVAEANALLPEIRELLAQIAAIRDRLVIDWQNAVPVLRAARMNGGGPATNAYLTDIHQMNARLIHFAGMGIELKDLEQGLIDFPAWRGDREVFLCWKLNESEVAFWHDLEAGFAGRQAI